MPTFNQDILELVRENPHYLEEIVTNEFTQVVLMSIEPGSDIGEEVHEADQVLVIVEGSGEAVLNRQHSPVQADRLVVVPAGTRHNVINTGTIALKLYTLYAPPAEAPGTRYQTKAEAIAAEAATEEDWDARMASLAVDRSNGRSKQRQGVENERAKDAVEKGRREEQAGAAPEANQLRGQLHSVCGDRHVALPGIHPDADDGPSGPNPVR